VQHELFAPLLRVWGAAATKHPFNTCLLSIQALAVMVSNLKGDEGVAASF